MTAMEQVQVVVAHDERATLRVGETFLKVDGDDARLDAEVDALLEEIDEVLETNAESFVRGFVQKGGE